MATAAEVEVVGATSTTGRDTAVPPPPNDQQQEDPQQRHLLPPGDNAVGDNEAAVVAGEGGDDDGEGGWEDIDEGGDNGGGGGGAEDDVDNSGGGEITLPLWDHQFYLAKDRFFQSLGVLDRDLLTFIINPFFMGGVRWPNLRQAYRVIRNERRRSLILISDGLCEPVGSALTRNHDDGEAGTPSATIADLPEEREAGAAQEDDIGLGVEVLVESSDPGLYEAGFADITGSWLFHVVQEAAGQVAAFGFNLLDPLMELGLMSMEINLEHPDIPRNFYNSSGRLILLFGLSPPADSYFPSTFQVPTSAAATAATTQDPQQDGGGAPAPLSHTAKVVTVKLVSFEDFERLNKNRAALAAECTEKGTFHTSSIFIASTTSDDQQQQQSPASVAAADVSAPTPPQAAVAAAASEATMPPPPHGHQQ